MNEVYWVSPSGSREKKQEPFVTAFIETATGIPHPLDRLSLLQQPSSLAQVHEVQSFVSPEPHSVIDECTV
jgi:hypothetical protein